MKNWLNGKTGSMEKSVEQKKQLNKKIVKQKKWLNRKNG